MMKQNDITKKNGQEYFRLQSRRYIGNKYKLSNWIFSIIEKECVGETFADIFAGTGVVAAEANGRYKKIILNDFLHSNHAIYQAFFDRRSWSEEKLADLINEYNSLNPKKIKESYFSKNFGGKYFTREDAKLIGFIREDIEKNKNKLSEKEFYVLLTSLLYSADTIANTVGHYDAYFQNNNFVTKKFLMRLIDPVKTNKVDIYREDANKLAKKNKG